jgi:uncharacterized protein YjbI with pentapeptide repeats
MKGLIKKLASKLRSSVSAMPTHPALNGLAGKKIAFKGTFARMQRWEKERVAHLVEAQQGRIVADFDASVDILVVPDVTSGKTAQQKAASLNARGAAIQVVELDAFEKQIAPTTDQVIAVIRGGSANAGLFSKAAGPYRFINFHSSATHRVVSESFDRLNLSGFNFLTIEFENCSFVGANLSGVIFKKVSECDFTKANCQSAHFMESDANRFRECNLKKAVINDAFNGIDFSGAVLDSAQINQVGTRSTGQRHVAASGSSFKGASLRNVALQFIALQSPDFQEADLDSATFSECAFKSANFRLANLSNANMVDNKFPMADFTAANLSFADISRSILTGARFDDADLEGADFSGAKLDGADLSKAKNYGISAAPVGAIGPALTELDSLERQAKYIKVQFKYQSPSATEMHDATVHLGRMHYVWGTDLSHETNQRGGSTRSAGALSSSAILLQMAARIKQFSVRYETLKVKSPKSSKTGKDLRDLVMNAIVEATRQPLPPADKLAELIKAYRQQSNAARASNLAEVQKARDQRALQKKQEEQQRQRELKKLERTIEKKVGKITDIATFLKALELRVEKPKIDKATAMLKAERFKLFNDVTDEHLSGVVKSQSDPDLIYACRIHKDGGYACCTQNLNICGGLRGSVCKHLLVLIVGLVKAGQLDPGVIDSWISKTHAAKPALDKEVMGEIFLKYKGAEAGEIDWRPTETLPEDFYAV